MQNALGVVKCILHYFLHALSSDHHPADVADMKKPGAGPGWMEVEMEELLREVRTMREELAATRREMLDRDLLIGRALVPACAAIAPGERVSIRPPHEIHKPAVGEGYTAAYYTRLAYIAQARERPA